MRWLGWISCLYFLMIITVPATANDGYELWLQYHRTDTSHLIPYRSRTTELVTGASSATSDIAAHELSVGIAAITGHQLTTTRHIRQDGAILIGTPNGTKAIAELNLPLADLGNDGFLIRSMQVEGHRTTVIAANTDTGVLYGVFRFLRLMQTGQPIETIDIRDAPKVTHRILDHWDNLDRTVERGYAGLSIWDWQKLPEYTDPRYTDYARANASVGINGVVLNNVNAQVEILTPHYLEKVAAIANALRPYGIRVYLTARFSAPITLGKLENADPNNPAVQDWWKKKTDEIYHFIPDFGGFLIKANSEGQPGPQDYGRNHAEGANMLADALAPHGGIVMWRAFVYSNTPKTDRVMQAYSEFLPLDGAFRSNVVLQVKNGPLDFQPREPVSPLFGAMQKTPLALEVQITKEYLGFATHLVYLAPLWQEVLQTDTYAKGKGTTVASIIDGQTFGHQPSVMAGVANIGTDQDWCGSIFNQANWYAFGRLAWNPNEDARTIATDWAGMTFTPNPKFVDPVTDMMMGSREAAVKYMTPLGLAHLMGTGNHYGPAPWVDNAGRDDWNPVYYHRADANGIGVDRTASGSNAIAQYADPIARQLADPQKTPTRFLLWFHHLPWDYRMPSGHTLWDELILQYDAGVKAVIQMQSVWNAQKEYVDAERFTKTAAFLAIQREEAQWWRDASVAYFQSVSHRPLPAGVTPPMHSLDYYKALKFPYVQ